MWRCFPEINHRVQELHPREFAQGRVEKAPAQASVMGLRGSARRSAGISTLGEEATELYELARDAVQRFIGATSREEVVFTRGTTDGLGLIAETIGRTLTSWS